MPPILFDFSNIMVTLFNQYRAKLEVATAYAYYDYSIIYDEIQKNRDSTIRIEEICWI